MIRFVIDSTAAAPQEFLQKHRIREVPLRLLFGTREFRDRVDIQPDEFFDMLEKADKLPTTSQPPISDFADVYKEILDEGDEIVVLTISSKLSGTYQSALDAADMFPDAPITVIDSLTTSAGMIFQAQEGLKAAEAGGSREEIARVIQGTIPRLRVYFLVDTLKYLQKGGRIGGGARFLGTLLNIKPMLQIQDGVVEAMEKARSKKRGLRRMSEIVLEDLKGFPDAPTPIVIHGRVPKEAKAFAGMLQESLGGEYPMIINISPVIGVHVGPGVIGVAYLLPEK